MIKTLYLTLVGGFFILLIAFFLSKRKETFRVINDGKGQDILLRLTANLRYLTDPSKFSFNGELAPLARTNIMDNITFEEGFKSFTENKQRVTLCLRNQHGDLYDQNSLMYVALHELAHVVNDELQHTAKFRRIFDALLKHATANGLYDPTQAFVRNYCS
jgi:hypothetical protein